MKKIFKILLLTHCIWHLPVQSQTTCTDFLNDFIPKTTDSTLEVNVTFWLLYSTGFSGNWVPYNDTTKADSCISKMNRYYANIPAPKLAISGVTNIVRTRIKFKRKKYINAYHLSSNYNYYNIWLPSVQQQYLDTNSINIIFGDCSGISCNPFQSTNVPGTRIQVSSSSPGDIGSDDCARGISHEMGHCLGLLHSSDVNA